jgi:hypothetical protein
MLQRLRYLANGNFRHALKYFQVEFICFSALFLLLSVCSSQYIICVFIYACYRMVFLLYDNF